MSLDSDLKKIEKKYLKTRTESGILELFIGCVFLWISIFELLHLIPINPIILFPVLLIVDTKVIRPRTGIIKFKRPPNSRIIKMIVFSTLMIGGGFLGLYIFFLIPWNPLVKLMRYTIILLWILPSFIHGISLGRNIRLSILALVVGLAFFLLVFFYDFIGNKIYGLISLGIIGAVLFTIGAILLIRFLRKYPKPPKLEDLNDK